MEARRRNPWLAFDAGTDPVERARELRRAHADYVGGGEPAPPLTVRAVIAESWRRSAGAGVRPEGHVAPRVHSDQELRELREEHALARMMPTFRSLLADVARTLQHLVVVCSAEGELLWVEGPPRVRVLAEDRMNFAEGTLWSEAGAGTNALGTAIAVRHPVQVFSAEHYNATVHPWTCSASPIFEPRTGRLLGTVDLTGPYRMAHPHSLALVTAAAGAASGSLHQDLWRDDERLREAYIRRHAHLGRRPTGVVTRTGRVVMADPIGWLGTHVGIPGDGGVGFLPGGATFRAEELPGTGGFLVWAAEDGVGPPRTAAAAARRGGGVPRRAPPAPEPPARGDPRPAGRVPGGPVGGGAGRGPPRLGGLPDDGPQRDLPPAPPARPGARDPAYRLTAAVEADFLAPAAPGDAELLPGSAAPGIHRLRDGRAA